MKNVTPVNISPTNAAIACGAVENNQSNAVLSINIYPNSVENFLYYHATPFNRIHNSQ